MAHLTDEEFDQISADYYAKLSDDVDQSFLKIKQILIRYTEEISRSDELFSIRFNDNRFDNENYAHHIDSKKICIYSNIIGHKNLRKLKNLISFIFNLSKINEVTSISTHRSRHNHCADFTIGFDPMQLPEQIVLKTVVITPITWR